MRGNSDSVHVLGPRLNCLFFTSSLENKPRLLQVMKSEGEVKTKAMAGGRSLINWLSETRARRYFSWVVHVYQGCQDWHPHYWNVLWQIDHRYCSRRGEPFMNINVWGKVSQDLLVLLKSFIFCTAHGWLISAQHYKVVVLFHIAEICIIIFYIREVFWSAFIKEKEMPRLNPSWHKCSNMFIFLHYKFNTFIFRILYLIVLIRLFWLQLQSNISLKNNRYVFFRPWCDLLSLR